MTTLQADPSALNEFLIKTAKRLGKMQQPRTLYLYYLI